MTRSALLPSGDSDPPMLHRPAESSLSVETLPGSPWSPEGVEQSRLHHEHWLG